MHLIGFTGKKRSGKDTACEMLAAIVYPRKVQRIGFADELYRDVARMLDIPVHFIIQNKDHFRLILQGYGTDYVRWQFGEDYWIRRWDEVYRESEADIVVVPDVRFVNEADFIQKHGGEVWRIKRQCAVTTIDLHVSENELDEFQFPTIDNGGSQQQMLTQLQNLYALYSTKHPVS